LIHLSEYLENELQQLDKRSYARTRVLNHGWSPK